MGSGINEFNMPNDVVVDSFNRIYVIDNMNWRVVRFDDMNGSNWHEFTDPESVIAWIDPGQITLSYYYY